MLSQRRPTRAQTSVQVAPLFGAAVMQPDHLSCASRSFSANQAQDKAPISSGTPARPQSSLFLFTSLIYQRSTLFFKARKSALLSSVETNRSAVC